MSGVDVTEPENKDDTGIRRDAQDSKGAENTDDTAIQQGRKTKMTPEFEKITLRWWVNRMQRRKRQLMKEKIRKDDDKIALRWRSTGNSDGSEHDEKMTGEREQRGDLIPGLM